MWVVPERWLACPSHGNLLPGAWRRVCTVFACRPQRTSPQLPVGNVGFVPFKSPLDPRYDEMLPSTHYWHVDTAVNASPSMRRIGLVADLTMSDLCVIFLSVI